MSSSFLRAAAMRSADAGASPTDDEPDAAASCPICFEAPIVQPQLCPNGHATCLACAQRWSQSPMCAGQITCCVCRVPMRLPQDELPPWSTALECGLIARERRTMRQETFRVGDEVAWVPQAYLKFLEVHGADYPGGCLQESLQVWYISRGLDAHVITAGDHRVQHPIDGTASAAIIVGIDTPRSMGVADGHLFRGLSLLRLRHTGNPAATTAASGPELVVPIIDRSLCDVDPHVIPLGQYVESLERVRHTSHVIRPFGVEDNPHVEELYEGRAFDTNVVWDPDAYPASRYQCLHVVWYVRSQSGWVFDDEQTDNFVSPWDTEPSRFHERWRAARQRASADMRTAHVVSVRAEADDANVILHVMRRLMTTEAAPHFFHPTTANGPSLSRILDRTLAGEFASVDAFLEEVSSLIELAFYMHEQSSIGWILACMLQKEVFDIRAVLDGEPGVADGAI